MDTGTQPVIIGGTLAARLQLIGAALKTSPWSIRTASGAVEPVSGETQEAVNITFKHGTSDEVTIKV